MFYTRKSQIPNHKKQTNHKIQITNYKHFLFVKLNFGYWLLFGYWYLVIGISRVEHEFSGERVSNGYEHTSKWSIARRKAR